jgi:uncharacterized protein YbjT (DUF2867 family)
MAADTIFVMGATGRVGGAVIDALPGEVRIRAATQREQQSNEIDWVQFSLEDETTFATALDGVDAIFLMRPPQITKGSAFVSFLEAAQKRGITRIVVLSVAGAESNAILPHHAMENVVMEMGFDWTMIRPSDFMQNLETVHLESIRDRDEIAVPAGQGRSSFIDVSDIGEVIAKTHLEDGHSAKGYTLTGPKALNFAEVANILTEVLGRPIRYRQIGAVLFLIEQMRRGQPIGMSLVMTALYTVQRFGKASTITGEVERLLGRPPNDIRHYIGRVTSLWRG